MRRQTRLIVLLALILALSGCAGGAATVVPTATTAPTRAPVTAATTAPTGAPTREPTVVPTTRPTTVPTSVPTTESTTAPTSETTAAPTAEPTTASTSAPTAIPTDAPTSGPTPPPPAAALPAEILYLSGRVLTALDPATGARRSIADDVGAFAAARDGRRLALVRGQGASAELWSVGRDGDNLRRLTTNNQAESGMSWAPDGRSLAFAVSPAPQSLPPEWQTWSEWCATAEVRVLDLESGIERAIGAGCEPTFSHDGRRIAFVTPPTDNRPGTSFQGSTNAVRIVNRQGANGWDVARSDGSGSTPGLLVYGPVWAPDGMQVAYQRFLGYQALTDINLTEASSSFERRGMPLGLGVGWMLPAGYAPDGKRLVVTEHNFSDARGFTGYDIWTTTVLRLGQQEALMLPSVTLTLEAVKDGVLERATGAAWSPDGAALAVVLPAGWQPGLSNMEPAFPDEGPGELWRWRPGASPDVRLAEGLDFGTPLVWLPAVRS